MIRLFLVLLFTASRFLPFWGVSLSFIIVLPLLYILWKQRKLPIENSIMICVPIIMLSYYIFPTFLFLLGSWTTLLLFPAEKETPLRYKIIPKPKFFASSNNFILIGLILLAYLAATISYGSLFNLKRIPFSILYGLAIFSILWIYFRNMSQSPFMLFFVSILYPILFIISRFDLGFHPAINIDLIIKGVFISAFFTMLFYLLDMIPKKMFLFFLGIQYVLVIIFGTKTFTLFVLYFIFQNLLIFSYGLKKEKPYDFITTPDNRIHYLVPGIISLLILFVGEKYNSQVWPFLAVSISFSIYSLYHHGLWQGFIRPRLSNKSLWTMHLTHFLFFNSILIVFFILLKVLSVMGFGTILPLLLAANITAGAYYYFTYVKKRDSLFGPLADTLLFSILPVFLMFTIQQLFNTLK